MSIEVRSVLDENESCSCGSSTFLLASKSWRGDIVSCARCAKFHFIRRPWWQISVEKIGSGVRVFFGVLMIPLIALVAFELFAQIVVIAALGLVGLVAVWLYGNLAKW